MVKEVDIQRSILNWLDSRKVFHWRSNNIAVRNRTFIGLRGVPDIICIIPYRSCGLFVGIEVKTKTGKQSEYQKEFERRCKEARGCYLVARSLQDVIDFLTPMLDNHQ